MPAANGCRITASRAFTGSHGPRTTDCQVANNHNGTWPGKRVRVKLKDGTVLIARFVRNEGKVTVLESDSGLHTEFAIRRDRITSLAVYKPQHA